MSAQRKISAIIVEDEGISVKLLQNMLSDNFPSMEICGATGKIEEAYNLIQLEKPDIAFVDIEIADGNAFDLLKRFSVNPFSVIFTTAYDNYAIKAIKHNAADYLLKPINESELVETVNKVTSNLSKKDIKSNFLELLEQVKTGTNNSKISIPTLGGLLFIDPAQVIHCRAEGSYSTLFVNASSKITTSRNLHEIEQVLPDNFFRVHKSHIVNLDYIHKYIQGRGGYIIMTDGSEIEVSARKKESFLKLFR